MHRLVESRLKILVYSISKIRDASQTHIPKFFDLIAPWVYKEQQRSTTE